ncbi:MAG: hypothetical protein ACRD0Y_11025 [Terriglobales bacterium]
MRGKSNVVLGCLALVLLVAAACTTSDLPGNPKASTAAVAATYQLAGQNWTQVYARFTTELQKALPPPQLAKLWQGFASKYGSFDSASAVGNRQDGPGKTNVVVACHFLKGTQYLLWTLSDSDFQITALHLAGGT